MVSVSALPTPLIPASSPSARSHCWPHPPYIRGVPQSPLRPYLVLPVLPVLFAEEPGLVLEVQEPDLGQVLERYEAAGLRCLELGPTGDAGPHALVRKGRTVHGGKALATLRQPRGQPPDSWP